ncbi:class I SAM-dependent methyltransferase [Planomonospora sp. ID67723]|uniref:class I SAM-dependent methyltransferase n=1 Tax=Planomonospora sp. ID67723 TaxID=2738134 RepID=UPI0018C42FAB|nr:class I SAM-dependent methyltransferase [Planomonospora sp. ID67723]MBG0827209.1 class I SAM-dependent methyltransferase [Planomonospora sp. ID67723]
MDDWRRARLTAVVYDVGVEHERIGRIGGRLLWGADLDRYYRDIDDLRTLVDGCRVLDVPCGGGIAFRGLPEDGSYRYAALDLSPVMLRRSRANAARHGLREIEFVQASATALPYREGGFDLCLSYFGLHCFPAPAAALAEMARVLRPGGRLRGSSVVRGSGRRQDMVISLFRRIGVFGTGGTADDLSSWLAAAGLDEISVERDGAVAFFSARRSPAPHSTG